MAIFHSGFSTTSSKHIRPEVYKAKLQESYISLKDLNFLGGVSLNEFSRFVVWFPSEEECGLDGDYTSGDGAYTC